MYFTNQIKELIMACLKILLSNYTIFIIFKYHAF